MLSLKSKYFDIPNTRQNAEYHLYSLQFVLLFWRSLANAISTYRWSTNLHFVHAFLRLDNLPNLIFLRTGHDDGRLSSRPVPAMLTILKHHGKSLPGAETLAVRWNVFVDKDGFEMSVRAHSSVSSTLLRLLSSSAHPAHLVLVFSRIDCDASTFQSTEYIVWAIVICKVLLVFFERVLVIIKLVLSPINSASGILNSFGFTALD